MNRRRIWVTATVLLLLCAGPAAAQFAPIQQQPAQDPWQRSSTPQQASPWDSPQQGQQGAPLAQPQQSPWQQPQQQQQQQMPPCIKEFLALRDDVGKRAQAIQAAQKRKAPIAEACRLFTAFVASQQKILKYATDHGTSCGIPKEIKGQITDALNQTTPVRTRVCQMAAQPQRQAGPSLSDALGASSIPDAGNIKTGRGTFDTLTGTPLGSR